MLSKLKRLKHQQHLAQLPKLSQAADNVTFLYAPADFHQALLTHIANARQRIYVVALYLEQDDGGKSILNALYQAKQQRPELDIRIFVDWHRAQRGRIGAEKTHTNADWYCALSQQHADIAIPVYGVPVNTREALGVLHLKGFVVDDTVIYSGASLNDVYLNIHGRYRYDRYQLLHNPGMADVMVNYIRQNLLNAEATQRLDQCDRPKTTEIKNETRVFRHALRTTGYYFTDRADDGTLSVTPLVGLGKHSPLNKTIHHLISSTEHKLVLCTPYFNLPSRLIRDIISLLRQEIPVEIIVGDKTANDFYIPESEPFKLIGSLPYFYEINLRRFIMRLQNYVDRGLLNVRLWKDGDNSYHLKGIWVDDKWTMITGNNLNPRAWRLDLENAILIRDPENLLQTQRDRELECIRTHTTRVTHYQELQSIQDYPVKVRKLIRRLRRIRIDKLINRIL